MKKLKVMLIILILLIVSGLIGLFLFLISLPTDPHMDCLESNYCKKGVVVKIHGDTPEEINKDTCLKYNGDWNENTEICQFPDYEYSFDKDTCIKYSGKWHEETHYCELPKKT